jgi:hypothetical protein
MGNKNPTIEELREKYACQSCDRAYIVALFGEEIDKLQQDKSRLLGALQIIRNNGDIYDMTILELIAEMEAEV